MLITASLKDTIHLPEIQGTALQTFGTNNQETFHCEAHIPVHILVHIQHTSSLVHVVHLSYFPVPIKYRVLLLVDK